MPNNLIITQEQISSINDRISALETRANVKTSAAFAKGTYTGGTAKLTETSFKLVPDAADDDLKVYAVRMEVRPAGNAKTKSYDIPVTVDMKDMSANVSLGVVGDERLIATLIKTGKKYTVVIRTVDGKNIKSTSVTINLIVIGY